MNNTKKVACFGEVLWDLLPTGKVAGGAPMNVAFHLKNLGLGTVMLSSVGQDELGRELMKFLASKGIRTDFIQVHPSQDTGTVQVTLDKEGTPTYEITQPVAWDFIEINDSDLALVKEVDALVFGSLAARSKVTQASLLQLLEVASLKVFDLNLRKPFYDREFLNVLLQKADLIKLSDEELEVLFMNEAFNQSEKEQLETVMQRYNLRGIIFTKGKNGATFLNRTGFYEQGIFPITVVDTIGSGDAFLAGFLSQYLQQQPIQNCLKYGAAMGALVATHAGGTPTIDVAKVEQFIDKQTN